YDVSHGLAVALYTRHHTVLYDTGGRWGRTDAGARIVVPQLAASGIRRLHTLVVSHGDLDHRGGAEAVLAAFPTQQLLAGEPQRAGRGTRCRDGQRWRLDGVVFEIIHPRPTSEWRGNNASCVLQVTARHGRVLLTGDLEALGEMSLLSRDRVGPQTVIVGQHHGSKTSSSRAFVQATAPTLAIFSTAFANRWGLPADTVTRRWQAVGARTCATAALGAVAFALDGRDVTATITAARTTRPALWRWTPERADGGWQGAFRVRTGRDILRASC
ncbi:MAG: MBL fold metallo-hydrolase, partial [Pseudomonadota bacterium]